jgi:hypothetical protein
MKEIKLFYYRAFKILTEKEAIELDLKFITNIYGDLINKYNCRSIWEDNKGRRYRVYELFKEEYLKPTTNIRR